MEFFRENSLVILLTEIKTNIQFDGKNPTFKIDDFFVKILWLITETKTLQFDGKNSTFRI